MKHHSGDDRQSHQQGGGAAQDAVGPVVVPLTHGDGRPGRTALSGQSCQSGNKHGDGETYTQSGEGQVAVGSHVTDVDAVHDVIQSVDYLCQNGGQRQPEKQRGNGRAAKIRILGSRQYDHSFTTTYHTMMGVKKQNVLTKTGTQSTVIVKKEETCDEG